MNWAEMAECWGIQAIVNQAAIQVAMTEMVALRDTDVRP